METLLPPSQPSENIPAAKRRHWVWIWLKRLFWMIFWLWLGSVLWVVALKWLPVPGTSLMLIRQWSIPNQQPDKRIYYQWKNLNEISPHLAVAVVAAEDQKFFQHQGFDWEAIAQAQVYNKTAKIKRGASTISQQVAKNVFLFPARSYLRKALEAYFTVLIELVWGKKRILEVYLNIVELGPQTFGVEAAAQRYFRKSALRIVPEEAAMMAAVLPNPNIFLIQQPNQWVWVRRNAIFYQMQMLDGTQYLQGF
ncbi:MAG TPA: monofunctional biosynthetic peptidoglycan transglycosylase [Microscillaceae bacterium]|nr:monofunctional biosynthetic peptidoglycan transglycosylase [Microscillaceae bacterium]